MIKKISIFGLGYVGAVLSACFAKKGFDVIGVDIDLTKVESINNGLSPIIEPELPPLILKAVTKGKLRATDDVDLAILRTDISMICVGTPSLANGDINLSYLKRTIKRIASALKKKNSKHTIIIRSTVFPGTTDSIIRPILKRAGVIKKTQLVCNPEFLREGTSVYDFFHPPKTVIGVEKKETGQFLMSFLYDKIPGGGIITNIKTAEVIKYIDNCFHGLKVSFANEVGMFCKSMGVDSHQIMNIFCQDKKLNLSSAYLKPGKPFGGSCLVKDIKALVYRAKKKDLELPVIFKILFSNNLQKKNIIKLITSFNKKNIGIIGLSFKENTDDLRHSPMIEIVESLLGKGYKLSIFDKNITLAKIFGSNKNYLMKRIPHISSLLIDNLKDLVKSSDIIVIANIEKKSSVLQRFMKAKIVIDLVGLEKLKKLKNYYGVYW